MNTHQHIDTPKVPVACDKDLLMMYEGNPKKFIIGNWKMYTNPADARRLSAVTAWMPISFCQSFVLGLARH